MWRRVGLVTVFGVASFKLGERHERICSVLQDRQTRCYLMLPLKSATRLAGWLSSVHVPGFLRAAVYGGYGRVAGCDVRDADPADYKAYETLQQFFTRSLRADLRPLAAKSELIAPADGTLCAIGRVDPNGEFFPVKGVSYNVRQFIGEDLAEVRKRLKKPSTNSTLPIGSSSSLCYCVIYLSPADCHRFFSPTNWQVVQRRHFPGFLLSVRPGLLKRIGHLLALNERVCYVGSWRHGFFSMSAVGATGVGQVAIQFDPGLSMNCTSETTLDFCSFENKCQVALSPGQAVGHFRLGSSLVLLFDAPDTWALPQQACPVRVKYGQDLLTAFAPSPP